MEKGEFSRSAWTTLIVLSSLGLITMYGETMVLPAIPDFIKEFSISYSTSSWILSSYLIAGAVMTPIAGKLSDIYGKKKILLIVMSIYSAGILLGGFANGIGILLLARAMQGVGMAMFPIAFGIIREVLPEKRLAMGQTIFSSTFSGGAVVGLIVGATIIQNFGWHATFFSIFPIAVGLGLIIRKKIVAAKPVVVAGQTEYENSGAGIRREKIDIKGTLALAATIVSFLAGLSSLQSEGTGSGVSVQVLGLFIAAGASLAAFIVIERKVSSPLVDFKLMTSKMLLPATIILMLVFLCIFMVYQTIPIMVRSPKPLGFGGDAVVTASVQLPFMAVLLIGTIMSGFALNRFGNIRLTVIGTAVSTIGFFSLLLFHSSEFMVSAALAVIASGLSLSITGGFNVVLLSAPIQSTGIALGMTLLMNLIGMSIGPSLAGLFQQINQASIPGIPGQFPDAQAYNLIFITAALVSIASVALALGLSASRRKMAPTILNSSPRKADDSSH